ncbi:MAG TPA: NAD-dependent epimerase/dehydratase family protein [Vicinamibacterales bacterium]
MHLVLTGASGFIGRHVLLRAPRDWAITALYHRTPIEPFIAQHGLTHVRAVSCDLLDARAVEAFGRSMNRPDAVLYLAANGDPAVSAAQPGLDLALNTTALVNFLEHCHAGHVVYMSSGAVYDGLQGPVSPRSSVSPRLPYAISKLAAEHYLRFFCEQRGSVNSFINVRFFGAYGPYEAARKITTRWLTAVDAGQREFVLRGNGENLIDFMYVDDAVDGLLSLTRAAGERMTVDFASGSPVTVNEVVRAMASVCDTELRVRHEGHTEEYIEFRSADLTMRERFGFRPTIALADGLARLREHLKARVNV